MLAGVHIHSLKLSLWCQSTSVNAIQTLRRLEWSIRQSKHTERLLSCLTIQPNRPPLVYSTCVVNVLLIDDSGRISTDCLANAPHNVVLMNNRTLSYRVARVSVMCLEM